MRIGYNREETLDFNERFGVIILAAGLSSRMKEFKPLLYVDGMTAIEGLIESAKAAGLEDITVVTGYNREALDPVIKKHGVHEVYNEDFRDGMFSSIKAGLRVAAGVAGASTASAAGAAGTGVPSDVGAGKAAKDGYLLMPVDCPLISTRVMRAVLGEVISGADGAATENFAVATFEGKKGHPIYIPKTRIAEIIDYDGPGGLSAITDKYVDSMLRVAVDEEGCILDMDTPEGYQEIREFVSKGFAREKLELLTARKRIVLVRHGETKQHDEPMFIGQYDVELNEIGEIQAKTLGADIARAIREDVEDEALGMDKFGREPLPAIERIYSSDLKRARQTAEIIRDEVNKILPNPVEIKYDGGLREINLGDWDGRPISEVKAEYPEEFERRGRDMFSFKLRNGMESFYDMQYRVIAAFREILRNDDAKDIIIVAHSGVLRVLENNIKGMKVQDDWEPMAKGTYRQFEPFPEQPSEKIREGEQPMSSDSLTMDAVFEYYE